MVNTFAAKLSVSLEDWCELILRKCLLPSCTVVAWLPQDNSGQSLPKGRDPRKRQSCSLVRCVSSEKKQLFHKVQATENKHRNNIIY